MVPPNSKLHFKTRGEYIISLVPKPNVLSEDENSDEEFVDEEELEKRVDQFFDTLPNLDVFDDVMYGLNETDDVTMVSALEEAPRSPVTQLSHSGLSSAISNPPSSIPATTTSRTRKRKSKKVVFNWKRKPFKKNVRLPNRPEHKNQPGKTPYDYFSQFFTEELFELIVTQSNLYGAKKFLESYKHITKFDLRDFLAIEIYMGIVKMPSFRDYWSNELRYAKVADIMTRNKFTDIRKTLHFADNEQDDGGDRFYKIRPVAEYLRKKFCEMEPEVRYSVDEMMCKYKGTKAGSRRQYMKDKPTKWGFKLFVRSGITGFIYDFLFYAGDDTFRNIEFTPTEADFPFTSKVVVALIKSIKETPLKAIFFDNFYNSPELMYYLRKEYGILSLGTLRQNRSSEASSALKSEKELKREGRGSFDVVSDNSKNVSVVRWIDNKPVLLSSTYTSAEPVGVCKRWSKGLKRRVEVPCPFIVKEYNLFMGGVDKSDHLIALYKTPLRSFKWYMALFGHLLDMALNNAWILYREDNPTSRIRLKKFRLEVASSLLYLNRKRRPSCTPTPPAKRTAVVPVPAPDVISDGVAHTPGFGDRGKCRHCHKHTTTVCCKKSAIRLCFVPNRNCFESHHEQFPH